MATSHFRIVGAQVSASGALAETAFGAGSAELAKEAKPRYRVCVPEGEAFHSRPAAVVTPIGEGRLHARCNAMSDDDTGFVDVDTYAQHPGGKIVPERVAFDLLAVRSGHGTRPLYDREDGQVLTVAAGTVGEAGGLDANHGLTSAAVDGDTVYTVHFGHRFASTPVVAVTVRNGTEQTRAAVVLSRSATSATVAVIDDTGANTKCAFEVIAIGPPKSGGAGSKARIVAGILPRGAEKKSKFGPLAAIAGDGFSAKQTGKATYEINFDEDFASTPVVVGVAEHSSEGHLRQAQIKAASKGGFTLEIYGRKLKSDGAVASGGDRYNTSAFHFIALLPT